MEYVKIFVDFEDVIEPLDMAERGRLLTAMMAYAKNGSIPQLTGNERFVWAIARQQIDRSAKCYENKVNGAAKARARKFDINNNQVDIKKINVDADRNETQSTLIRLDNPQEQEQEQEQEQVKKKRNVFVPPSVQEIEEYCNVSGHRIDANAFVDWYGSVGWKVGSKPMKDWKAAVRNWERRDNERPKKKNYYPDMSSDNHTSWMNAYIKR